MNKSDVMLSDVILTKKCIAEVSMTSLCSGIHTNSTNRREGFGHHLLRRVNKIALLRLCLYQGFKDGLQRTLIEPPPERMTPNYSKNVRLKNEVHMPRSTRSHAYRSKVRLTSQIGIVSTAIGFFISIKWRS